jgi:hypothetical protein
MLRPIPTTLLDSRDSRKAEAPGSQNLPDAAATQHRICRAFTFSNRDAIVWIENCISIRIMYIVRPRNAARLRHHGPSIHRYPIRAAVAYRLIGRDRFLKTGIGWTISLSSRSVLVESETGLPLDRRVDLWIEWPARLENKVGLRLHIEGRTVSAADTATEVEILGYEFRTCARPPQRINEVPVRDDRVRLAREGYDTDRPRLIQYKSDIASMQETVVQNLPVGAQYSPVSHVP